MDIIDIIVRGVVGGIALIGFCFAVIIGWRLIKALIRALHPRSLGRASAVAEKQLNKLLSDFKAGRESGS